MTTYCEKRAAVCTVRKVNGGTILKGLPAVEIRATLLCGHRKTFITSPSQAQLAQV